MLQILSLLVQLSVNMVRVTKFWNRQRVDVKTLQIELDTTTSKCRLLLGKNVELSANLRFMLQRA